MHVAICGGGVIGAGWVALTPLAANYSLVFGLVLGALCGGLALFLAARPAGEELPEPTRAWLTGGAAYARASAERLQIADCFSAFLPKPQVMIDFSHANSSKQHKRQINVGQDVGGQIAGGEMRVIGVIFLFAYMTVV